MQLVEARLGEKLLISKAREGWSNTLHILFPLVDNKRVAPMGLLLFLRVSRIVSMRVRDNSNLGVRGLANVLIE
jgi:hypothetical protein